MAASYTIRAVAEKTGLTAHTIRAWERRYGLLSPERTGTNRRMYDDRDVERLRLVVRAMEAGHSVGVVAGMPNEELAKLGGSAAKSATSAPGSEDFLAQCERAMLDLDSDLFQSTLRRANAVLGVERFLKEVVLPMLSVVTKGWESGAVQIAHEHFASAFLRTELERIRYSIAPPSNAPRLLVTTPSGHVHELGALLVAITAARHGWRITYLGPNLPAGEVAAAARQISASAVALSLVYPESDPRTVGELRRLREQVGAGIPILVGGAAARSYREVLDEIGATVIGDLDALAPALAKLA
jgi:DNA-binding transcriptional MerR regulator/methylmalonyl-CoA mutase cobalamin-binding subunit